MCISFQHKLNRYDLAMSALRLGANHWTLVVVVFKPEQKFLFVDPMGVNETQRSMLYVKHWINYCHAYNGAKLKDQKLNDLIFTSYEALTVPHQCQNDATTCGIWCMCVSKTLSII